MPSPNTKCIMTAKINVIGLWCGVFSLCCLFFDCWSEVFCPVLSRSWVILGFVASLTLIISVVLVWSTNLISVRRCVAPNCLRMMAIRSVLCFLLLLAACFKCQFFGVGAVSRVSLCGGADNVRQRILANFMDPDSGRLRMALSNSPIDLPIGMRDDGEYTISSSPTKVMIQIPARHSFADSFFYVILLDENASYLDDAFRTWKIGKGFYFCEANH